MEKLNEDFTNLYKRWKGGELRKENKIEFVDLDLPSGLLWANRNVGAGDVLDSGYFLAWGEIKEKDEYSDENYKFDLTEYNANKKFFLDSDVVRNIVPNNCRMPNKKDYQELLNYTKAEEVKNYNNSGVNVILFTPKKCRKKIKPTLIFPLCGYKRYSNIRMEDSVSFLWSSEIANEFDKAVCVKMGFEEGMIMNIQAFVGCNVRCVKDI